MEMGRGEDEEVSTLPPYFLFIYLFILIIETLHSIMKKTQEP
jgi:hypothetical protein